MIAKYTLDALVDAQTAIAITEELKACSINVELIENFNEKTECYEDIHLEIDLSELDVVQAFKTGKIVEDVVNHHTDLMWKEKRSIEQEAYVQLVKDGSQISIPFNVSDYEDLDV